MHSLIKLLTIYSDVHIRLYSPPSLELPDNVHLAALQAGHRVTVCDSVVAALSGADVVYATRVQRERMTDEISANVIGSLLTKSHLLEADASEILIMHPLPRDSRADSFDLSTDVDDMPGLSIFKQTDNGVLIRMAIFLTALGCSADAVQATTKQRPWRADLDWR